MRFLKIFFLVLFIGQITCLDINASDGLKMNDQNEIEVYILAGQSNAVGYNNINTYYPAPFPKSLKEQKKIMFWAGSNSRTGFKNVWKTLQIGASKVGVHAFGPEITFASRLTGAKPGQKIAIIKFAVGGTGIARSKDYKDFIPGFEKFDDKGNNWFPPIEGQMAGNYYNSLIKNIKDALNSLEKQRINYRLAGFIWMQGEHEAGLSLMMAKDYQKLLSDFLSSLRKDINSQNLPAVIGQISDKWIYGAIVKKAQEKMCAQDTLTSMVVTKDVPRNPNDDSHYTANGMVELGFRFAEVMIELQKKVNN